MTLLDNYLEMVIQFGFVAMFASGLTIAPIFALLNNIFEIRIDAIKMVKSYRRPVPSRVDDIGAWYHILKGLIRVSVITNALLIAFTSDFIDREVYKHKNNGDMAGYVDWSLSNFTTSHWPKENYRDLQETTVCRWSEIQRGCTCSDLPLSRLPRCGRKRYQRVVAGSGC